MSNMSNHMSPFIDWLILKHESILHLHVLYAGRSKWWPCSLQIEWGPLLSCLKNTLMESHICDRIHLLYPFSVLSPSIILLMLKAAIMFLRVCKKLKRKLESIIKKPQCKKKEKIFIRFDWPSIHRLTNPKGVHSFRYFLQPTHSPTQLLHIYGWASKWLWIAVILACE